MTTDLRVEGERGADLVGGGAGSRVVELGGVKGETEGGLDAGAEGLGVAEDKDTSVVDLGLDKGGVVKVSLGTDLERDTAGGRLGVVDGLGAGLDVLRDLVVVRGREGREVAETVEGDGVLGGGVAEGSGVAGEGTGLDVVRGLGTDEEAVVADNGVSGEGRTLERVSCKLLSDVPGDVTRVEGRLSANNVARLRYWCVFRTAGPPTNPGRSADVAFCFARTYLEDVDGGTGVDGGLLVDGSEDGTLLRLGGVEGGGEVELEALGNLVLELNLGAEEVRGGPSLGR